MDLNTKTCRSKVERSGDGASQLLKQKRNLTCAKSLPRNQGSTHSFLREFKEVNKNLVDLVGHAKPYENPREDLRDQENNLTHMCEILHHSTTVWVFFFCILLFRVLKHRQKLLGNLRWDYGFVCF